MLQVFEPKTLTIGVLSGLQCLDERALRSMRADRLITENINELLRVRELSQKDLADWCRKSEAWISFKLKGKRDWHSKELDRVADFFGIAAYQLLQPGIARSTERRRGFDRRDGKERRISAAARVMLGVGAELDSHRPHAAASPGASSTSTSLISDLKRLASQFEGQVSALISEAESRRPPAKARAKVAPPRAGDRDSGAADAEGPRRR